MHNATFELYCKLQNCQICKRKQTADTCKFVPHHRSISEIDVRIYYEIFKNDPNHAKQRRPLGLVKY